MLIEYVWNCPFFSISNREKVLNYDALLVPAIVLSMQTVQTLMK